MEYKAYYGLPDKVVFCRECVISNQRPGSTVEFTNKNLKKETIQFNEEGICSACQYNRQKKEIDYQRRQEALFEFLDRYRKSDGTYDVIVPSSGGKDSSFTTHCVKTKYKMNPLAVTWAPHIYTEVGWRNFNNLSRTGGVDSILYTPNGDLHRLLTRLAFENLCHPFQPFIHGQKIIGPSMALKFGVSLVMYGENQAEYGNDIRDNLRNTMDYSFFSVDNPLEMVMGGMAVRDIIEKYGFSLKDFAPYIPPKADDLRSRNIQVHYLGFYERWDPQEMYYYASEHTGFQAAPERSIGTYSKYTEIDDILIPFHFYTTYIKFGIGRATYDAAQEIRNGKIAREEGVALVRKYDGEFPEKYFKQFLEYMNISEERFWEVVDNARSPHLWKKENNRWVLRHAVAEELEVI
ncbi:MAG: LPS biosynthesis protein [Omnitrophica WOR_2 bacterium RIFCSPHIGHO2_02_FULL_50_17]|nr:MAG: LPS biosynthesis protein [Omnitrophica WOR_2 bacterium RIFCSPHIGHO2_02_FULL_50_17]